MDFKTVKRLVVIDNYDSFTYNLVQMFMVYDLDITVVRSDKISIEAITSNLPDYIVISPGPKDPQHAGISIELIRALYKRVPILGVCLGMQCFNEVFSGHTIRATIPVHGKTSLVYHHDQGIFKNIPSPFVAARYHSLTVKINSPELIVTATTSDNLVMGMAHCDYPVFGVQFHPESFMTEYGWQMINNFLSADVADGRR
ncbi:MAG: aminodeoxychorismate/anthranilate synthase component II [Desulfobacterales bacterium]|nr:aminodeoxychorismate/anthranilate synthase component II [Desulfobacterales bacterium]